MKRCYFILLFSMVLSSCSPPGSTPAPLQAPAPAPAPAMMVIGRVDDPQAVRAFLLSDAIASSAPPPAAVVARTVDGGPAHPRITLVYMADADWCGSGGCALLVLESGRDGLKQLSRSTLSYPPVRVLKSRSNGMPDLSVRVRGDYYPGNGPKFVALPFDGQAYALNPTVPPARLLSVPVEGEIAITEADVATAFRQ